MYKEETKDDIFQHRSHEGEIFENLDNFTNISDKVLAKVL